MSEPPSDDRESESSDQTDTFGATLISTLLVAALLVVVMVLIDPPSTSQAPVSMWDGAPLKPAETFECSDLDYAYQRC